MNLGLVATGDVRIEVTRNPIEQAWAHSFGGHNVSDFFRLKCGLNLVIQNSS